MTATTKQRIETSHEDYSKKKLKKLGNLVTAFLRWVERNKSENTYKMYSGRLAPFARMFKSTKIKHLTPLMVDQYLDQVNYWQDGREKAPDTIRANIVALDQLQKFAIDKEITTKRFIGRREKPVGRQRERLPTLDEVEQIKAASSPEFRLAYQALRQCGARPNELARATVADWKQSEKVIELAKHKTAKKTGKPRRISVGSKLEELIRQSLGDRSEGPLFLSPRGKQWTTESLSSAFRRARNKLGLDRQIVLYTARHEHGTAICKSISLDAAADALGHTSTNMTRRYVHKDKAELCSNQDAFDS